MVLDVLRLILKLNLRGMQRNVPKKYTNFVLDFETL